MSRRLEIYQVDAFTDVPFKGNPAGVVLGADALSAVEMQAIARELNNPVSAFVLEADGADHDFRIRFFTPTTEVSMCGHATVAANHVRALRAGMPELRATQKTRAGIVAVDVRARDGRPEVWMTLPVIETGRSLDGRQRDRLLGTLELRDRDLLPNAPIQVASSGNPTLLVPLRERAALHALAPDAPTLAELCDAIGALACFPFTLDAEPDVLTHARMFAPTIGIAEDPVSGTAHGPLGIYLVKHSLARHDGKTLRFRSRQGEAMGRPGTASVEVDIAGNAASQVRVGGTAVIAFEARLELPDGPAAEPSPPS
jgi:PhzF family phenazine biosynthesis protein